MSYPFASPLAPVLASVAHDTMRVKVAPVARGPLEHICA